ncbi:MAG TPA: chloride channel protein [Gaiellaceae bacterium]|nr:chloride channel protein [Gaiellaceae bacterium]
MTEARPDLGGTTYLQLVGLGALIGVPAALVAALFLALVHDLEHWLWTDLPDRLGHSSPPSYLVVGLPLAGAFVVLVARRFLPGDGGVSPLLGLQGEKPPPISHAPGIALAAVGTLSFGAVLGPEMPLIALGMIVGLLVTPILRLGERESSLLAGAGAFSAISALFGGPIVGGVLMVESGAAGLGGSLAPALLPGFVAAATGYVVFIGFGNWGGLGAPGLVEPGLPPYQGTHIYDLIFAVVVGVVTAILVAVVRRLAHRVADSPVLSMPLLLLGGGLAVGVLAEVADLLGADSQDVLFSGQASVPALVAESSTKIVLVLLVFKGLAYAISLGCGFRGGPIFPAIYVGVAVMTLPVVWFDISPTVAVAIGAAAGMAAMTGLLLTPMLFAALLVGLQGVDTVPAAVLAASAAWLAMRAIDRRTEETSPAAT